MTFAKMTFAAALAVASLGASAALAEDGVMTVRLAAYDLNSPQGAEIALRQIKNAAQSFCGVDNTRDLGRIHEQQACVDRMTGKAVNALNAPRVSTLAGTSSHIVLAVRQK